MKSREAQFWVHGTGTFVLPKSNESYRIHTLTANFATANAVNPQAALLILDGAGNLIAGFATLALQFGTGYNVTFAAVSADYSMWGTATPVQQGGQFCCEIPNDLWIQPQWDVVVQFTPNDATDDISQIVLVTDRYTAPKTPKNSLKSRPTPEQDAPP